jgi:hypothetical protein
VGGEATFSGTVYQANVIAYAAVHVLTETKLRWLPVSDDTPIAVSGEVKGPGDDARIEFASPLPPIEIQAKHGLKGPGSTSEVVDKIQKASASTQPTVVILAVDSSSSPTVRNELRMDLDRIRSGRTDSLREITKRVIDELVSRIGDPVTYIPGAAPGSQGAKSELIGHK